MVEGLLTMETSAADDLERISRAGRRARGRHADASGMKLHAAVALRRLGRLLGGDAGLALVAEADAWMVEPEIADRERVVEVFAQGSAT